MNGAGHSTIAIVACVDNTCTWSACMHGIVHLVNNFSRRSTSRYQGSSCVDFFVGLELSGAVGAASSAGTTAETSMGSSTSAILFSA